MNLLKAIGFKLISALLFATMSALVRQLGNVAPVGQMVFFRSAFAVVPVVVIYALRGELMSAVRTSRPLGQLGRGLLSVFGMFTNFSALTRLPLADATAISFGSPLITVVLAAVVLKERVRIYRWSAVLVGFAGVIVMLIPHFNVGHYAAAGAAATAAVGSMFAMTSAVCNAGTVIQTRRLTQSETTPSIVFYFSIVRHRGRAYAAVRLAHADRIGTGRADLARCARRRRPYFSDGKLSFCHGVGGGAIRLHLDAVGAHARLLAVRRIAERAGLCRRRHRRWRRAVRDLA
jgi:uncharacterized membrane protein